MKKLSAIKSYLETFLQPTKSKTSCTDYNSCMVNFYTRIFNFAENTQNCKICENKFSPPKKKITCFKAIENHFHYFLTKRKLFFSMVTSVKSSSLNLVLICLFYCKNKKISCLFHFSHLKKVNKKKKIGITLIYFFLLSFRV